MAIRSSLAMDKLSCHKGYLMLDLLLALIIITILTTLTSTIQPLKQTEYYEFHDAYLHQKSIAMLQSESLAFNTDDTSIYFNDKGNVNQARTVSYNVINAIKEYTIQLGTGVIIAK